MCVSTVLPELYRCGDVRWVLAQPRNWRQRKVCRIGMTRPAHIDNCHATPQAALSPGLGDVENHVPDIALVASAREAVVEDHHGRGLGEGGR